MDWNNEDYAEEYDHTGNYMTSNRNDWEFLYKASELAAAAQSKKEYREERVTWWEAKKAEVLAKVREEGLEISESLATSYMSNAGHTPQISVKQEYQTQLRECQTKIQAHSNAARDYDGWVQVLSANPAAMLSLKHGDWLFFFGKN